MPDHHPTIEPADRAAWRAWLTAHHADQGSVWLVIPRQGQGQGALTQEDATLDALCFGWTDSRPRKLDATRSLLLMSPRRPGSAWSDADKARVQRLIAAGLMAQPGEAAILRSMADGGWTRLDDATALAEPEDLLDALRAAPGAMDAWREFPDSHRRANLEWVAQAKRPITRRARITEIAARAALGQRASSAPRA